MSNVKNIIFDLGGVLLNINPQITNQAFASLGITDFQNKFALHKMNLFFENVELGKISDEQFYQEIKQQSILNITNEQIKNAWNALLLNFRTESLIFLETNAAKYNLFLLSNTNSIHHSAFSTIFNNQIGQKNFDDYFTKAYYSHLIGLRKPNKEIYTFVLQDAQINANETLFIDDLSINTDAAASLGLHTHQLLPHQKIEDLGL